MTEHPTDRPRPVTTPASELESSSHAPTMAASESSESPESPTDAVLPQASGPPPITESERPGRAEPAGRSARCPVCGTEIEPGATFCEACGADVSPHGTGGGGGGDVDFTADHSAAGQGAPGGQPGLPGGSAVRGGGAGAVATPQTAPAGEESPLDVGWTGVVAPATTETLAPDLTCPACGQGQIVDGYCDQCGTPPPDPRNHYAQAPAAWVGGVCDIGRRHSRNEDAMCLSATEGGGSRAVLVVCDGVSMATDSHIASLAAAQAALAVLDQPFPRGVGTVDAWAGGAGRALTTAVTRANAAVAATVVDDVPNPPSCTFAAAVIENGVIVAANVGDSRVYWLPDDPAEPARQLGSDDSFAQEQMNAGVDRQEAETGPQAHAITRWLGRDSPDDLTPHLTTVVATPGWLMVCSDGLWNYCSEPQGLRELVLACAAAGPAEQTGPDTQASPDPVTLAQALVDFANAQGGRDNITVALARLAGRGSKTGNDAPAAPATVTPLGR